MQLKLCFISLYPFTPVVPQSVRNQSSCQYLFTLLGPTSVQAVRRTLMKLTPGADIVKIDSTTTLSVSVSIVKNGLSDLAEEVTIRCYV